MPYFSEICCRSSLLLSTKDNSHLSVAEKLYALLEENGISNVITDTAGRRDLLHMRLTTPSAFIRYTGANHASDYARLDDWVERLVQWAKLGIEEIDFFVHQNMEVESPLLAAYFIEKVNQRLGLSIPVPRKSVP